MGIACPPHPTIGGAVETTEGGTAVGVAVGVAVVVGVEVAVVVANWSWSRCRRGSYTGIGSEIPVSAAVQVLAILGFLRSL